MDDVTVPCEAGFSPSVILDDGDMAEGCQLRDNLLYGSPGGLAIVCNGGLRRPCPVILPGIALQADEDGLGQPRLTPGIPARTFALIAQPATPLTAHDGGVPLARRFGGLVSPRVAPRGFPLVGVTFIASLPPQP